MKHNSMLWNKDIDKTGLNNSGKTLAFYSYTFIYSASVGMSG